MLSVSDGRRVSGVSFVIHASDTNIFNGWRHAIFELCCRVGVRSWFQLPHDVSSHAVMTVHCLPDRFANIGKLPEDAYVIAPSGAALDGAYLLSGRKLSSSTGPIGDIIAATVDLLSFSHECEIEKRDAYGRVAQSQTRLADVVRSPLVDNAAAILLTILQARFPSLQQIPRPWGQGKIVVAITHDVDGPQLQSPFALLRSTLHAVRGRNYERESLEAGIVTRWLGRPDPYWTFDHWVRLNKAAFNAPSTFYFFSSPNRTTRRHYNDPHYRMDDSRFKDQLRRIADSGCEIGIHFGINARSTVDFRAAIGMLERISDSVVLGSRTHYWTGVWDDPYAAWERMQRAGLKYDASLNPLEMGYRAGISNPIIPSFRENGVLDDAFVVLPTAVMDAYAHPRYSPRSPQELQAGLDEIIGNAMLNGFIALDWHERVLSNIGAWKGFMGPYFILLNALRARADVEFLNGSDAAKRWLDHARDCLALELGVQ